jgi:ADP-glucose pyrophosphorylase
MGIYCFETAFLFDLLRNDARSAGSSHDFGHDVIPAALARNARVFAHRFETSCIREPGAAPYWRDVGTLDAYWAANLDLARVQPELDMYDESWPVRTLQQQRPPAKFILGSPDGAGQTSNALVSSGCIISGAAVRNSLLFSDVWAEQGSIIEDSVVLPRVRIGRNVRLRRAVVDKYCSCRTASRPASTRGGFAADSRLRRRCRADHARDARAARPRVGRLGRFTPRPLPRRYFVTLRGRGPGSRLQGGSACCRRSTFTSAMATSSRSSA